MRRRSLAVAGLILLTVTALGALDVSDPQDQVYRWLDLWHRKGYYDRLPYLKPYPIQLVETLLGDVVRHGNAQDKGRAESFLEKIDKEPTVNAIAYGSGTATADTGFGLAGGYATTSGYVSSFLTASGLVGAVSVVSPEQWNTMAPGQWPEKDFMVDWGAVTVEGLTVLPTVSAGGALALGNDRYWFQSGFNRNSFGPFDEGPVLSPQAVQTGHFSVSVRSPRLVYSNFLLAMTATRDDGTAFKDDGSRVLFPNKYLAGQSLQLSIRDWLEIATFETIVFGERFDPLYLVPAIPKTYTSVATGAVDNMLLGLGATFRLPADVNIDIMVTTDDLHFLDFIKLDFDTKLKVSAQAGVSWTPLLPYFKHVSLDYALVTPYTYTHRRESIVDREITPPNPYDINFLNYTHSGRSLVAIEPNSDRARLTALTAIPFVDDLDVTFTASFQRHANATTDAYVNTDFVGTTDGGINDNGYDSGKEDHNFATVEFLSQDVIERTLLLGIEANYGIPLTPCGGEFFLSGGYILELSWNKRGDDPNSTAPIDGNDVVANHLTFGVVYEF